MNKIDKLIEVLKNISINSCPLRDNFHCHTLYSDGSLDPIELFLQAKELGINNIAITDHHSIQAYIDVINYNRDNKLINTHNTNIWSGIEISGLILDCMVHIIGLGFDVSSNYIQPYISGNSVIGELLKAENIVNNIRNAGGISILAHPARYRLPFPELIYYASNIGFDGIEVWYDYERNYNWKPTPFVCDKILELSREYKMLSTCGTDTHGLSLLRR